MDTGYVKIIDRKKAEEIAKKLSAKLIYEDEWENRYFAYPLTHKDWLIIAVAGAGKIAIMPSFSEAVSFIVNEGKGTFSEKQIEQALFKLVEEAMEVK